MCHLGFHHRCPLAAVPICSPQNQLGYELWALSQAEYALPPPASKEGDKQTTKTAAREKCLNPVLLRLASMTGKTHKRALTGAPSLLQATQDLACVPHAPPPTPRVGPLPHETPDLGKGLTRAGPGPSSCLQSSSGVSGGDCESDYLQHRLRFTWKEGEEGVMTPRVRSLQEEGRWPPLPTVPSPPTSLFPWAWDPLTGTHPS